MFYVKITSFVIDYFQACSGLLSTNEVMKLARNKSIFTEIYWFVKKTNVAIGF